MPWPIRKVVPEHRADSVFRAPSLSQNSTMTKVGPGCLMAKLIDAPLLPDLARKLYAQPIFVFEIV